MDAKNMLVIVTSRGAMVAMIWLAVACLASLARGAEWYEASWVHAHISISPPANEIDSIGTQIKAANLDAVQFHTHRVDLWEAVRQSGLDRKLDFKMVATINAAGTWYDAYDNDPAYMCRVHPDGTFAGRWDRKHLCFNAPVVRERVIPRYFQQLPARLEPDQIWIDECIITVNLCWCEHCKRLYHQQHGAEPPTKLTADNRDEWARWTTFHRKSFERWTHDVHRTVDTSVPGTLVTFNHAWFVEQPETPPAYVKNLSADIHRNPLKLGLYARYGGSGPVPFDLMPGLGSDIWAGVLPKKPDEVLNDVALVNAHGGRWNIGEYPTNSTSVRAKNGEKVHRPTEAYVEIARQGAVFARERQPFCQHTTPVAHVALLHSASSHYDRVILAFNGLSASDGFGETSDGDLRSATPGSRNSRIYWPDNNPIDESLVGGYQALLESHVHFNFTIEDRLAEDLEHAVLLVVPEQHRLSLGSIVAIKDYVRGGGRVLATGTTRRAGLDELFDYESQVPKTVGKGQTLFVPDNLFLSYFKASGYSHRPKGDATALRARAARLFETMLPHDPYRLDAPPWIEWTLRRSADGKELLIHLINRKINWGLPTDPVPTRLRCEILRAAAPHAVTLEPGGDAIKWRHENGKLLMELDPAAIPCHRVIRIR